jgi:hypothetical protein
MNTATNPFADMVNDLDFTSTTTRDTASFATIKSAPTEYSQRCGKCGGSGTYYGMSRYGSQCFACKGVGHKAYKTAPEVRARAAVSRANATVRIAENNWESFTASHPEVAAWMDANTSFEFAVSLKQAVIKYGQLTERQLVSAETCVAKQKVRDAARVEATQARAAAAPVVDISKVETAIATALERGVKRPSMRVGELKFSVAPATGKNAGAIYVKTAVKGEEGQYLGKIMGGKLFAVRECSEEQKANIISVASDPKGAAIRHGKEFGQCSICSRTLVDPKSIELGIGPICADKMGW